MSAPDLPQPLQGLYETVAAHLETQEGHEALEALVTPYRAAQQAWAAGSGLYRPHPAFHVRSKGDKVWKSWPDNKPMPTLMDLLMLAHEKNDPAESQEDA